MGKPNSTKTRVPRFFRLATATLVVSLSVVAGGVICGADFSDAERTKAAALVAQLRADDFAEREAAAKALQQLPVAALPWLGEQIEAADVQEIELRSRLKSIVRTLKKRDAELGLRDGSRIKIELKDAKPDAVLDALDEGLGATLSGASGRQIWSDRDAADFSFEGSYWQAVEAMMKAFPPKAAGREDLGKDYRIARWIEADFAAAGNASVSKGILRVRHARMALENSGGKDYLVLNLVPSVEPIYQVESLALLVKGLKFDDGTLLEPEEKICEWKPEHNGARYHPGGTFTWIFPLEKEFALARTAKIEAAAELKVRKMSWFEVEMPEDMNEAVKMNSNVELKILEREDTRLKIQFEGSGSEPLSFDDYELRKEAYEVLDKDGEKLEFNVSSTSSGGGKGWRNSFGGKIKGEPAKVKARLPGGEQEVQLKFELGEVPLPGSSLGG